MKKRIGVTGGTGFIGRYLLRDYVDQYDFVCATSQSMPIAPIPGVEYKQTDYSEESYRDIFRACDAIIHLGAKIPDSVTVIGSLADYWESVASSENVLRAAAKERIRLLVNLSSVSVYDKHGNLPFREDAPCAPDNSYGIAKAAIEMMCRLYENTYGINVISLRVSQVLGYRRYHSKGFYSVLQECAFTHQPIPIFGSGAAARDYVYVKDVAQAIICALEHPDKPGVYNIGSGTATTNLELAETYCAAFDNAAGIERVPVEKEDTRYWYMDIQKAWRELGFKPQYDLLHMVRDIRKELEMIEMS